MDKIKIGKLNNIKRRRTNIVDKDELEGRRRRCMNALLNRPWITKENDQQLYYWIKEQYKELRDWFTDYTGYSLIINSKLAKLDKVPVVAFPWMGFQEFREPLDYALFTYSLWFLESKGEGEQFLLTDLVRDIKDYMNEGGMEVDWRNYFQRLAMARALKKLKSLDIIRAVDGQESEWANKADNNDVLYECTTYSQYILRTFPNVLTSYTNIDDLNEVTTYGDSTSEHNRRIEHRLYRRFLLEPIVLDSALQNDSIYLQPQKNRIIKQLKSTFGWEGSKYREGLLFFEPEMMAESEVFPTLSSISDLTLLLLGEVRKQVNDPGTKMKIEFDGSIRITKNEIEQILLHLKEMYGEYWINDYRKMKSILLAEAVCQHIVDWSFGYWEDSIFFVLNGASGRWQVEYGAVELND